MQVDDTETRRGDSGTEYYLLIGTILSDMSHVYLVAQSPNQPPVLIASVSVPWLDDNGRIANPPQTRFAMVAPTDRLPRALAPYRSALVWFLSTLGTYPEWLTNAPDSPVFPSVAMDYAGALRAYDLIKQQSGNGTVIPPDVYAVVARWTRRKGLNTPDFNTAVAAGGWIDESTLVELVRLALAERAAQLVNTAMPARTTIPVVGRVPSLTSAAATAVARLPIGARNVLPTDLIEYVGRHSSDPFRAWATTCSASPDPSTGALPGARRLLDAAATLGVTPTDAQRTDPTLLCTDLAWPAVSATFGSVYGVGPAGAPAPIASRTQIRQVTNALDNANVDYQHGDLLNIWREVCHMDPRGVVPPDVVRDAAALLQEWGIDIDGAGLAQQSAALLDSGSPSIDVVDADEFVDDTYAPLLALAHSMGIQLSDDDILHPARLCSLLASIVFDPRFAQERIALPRLT